MTRSTPGRRSLLLTGLAAATGLVAMVVPPAAAQQPPPPTPTPEAYRENADEVLSRREFQRPEPSLLDQARDWIGERIDDLVGGATGGGTGTLVGWLVLVAALGALAWSLTRLGRNVRRDPEASASIRIDEGRTPGQWRAAADDLEGEGDWKRALLYRYRALLGDLVRRGVIEDVPGRTTGEYLREVTGVVGEGAAAFAVATELFEAAWYADLPTGPDEVERFRSAADVTLGAVDRTGRSPEADEPQPVVAP